MLVAMVQRMTKPTLRVLACLLDAAAGGCYGLELIENAQVRAGTVYPMLTRLEESGWVSSHWEDIDARQAQRPARRYYELTANGRVEAVAALEKHQTAGLEGLAEA